MQNYKDNWLSALSISEAINLDYDAGCFHLSFDDDHYGLQFYNGFTQLDIGAFRFSDQSLFIDRVVFFQLQGFPGNYLKFLLIICLYYLGVSQQTY